MAKAKDRDLFDDSTMSFGEHLEELRKYLWRAIVGLVIGTVIAFLFADKVLHAIQVPVVRAMKSIGHTPTKEESLEDAKANFFEKLKKMFTKKLDPPPVVNPVLSRQMEFDSRELWEQLHKAHPQAVPEMPTNTENVTITVTPKGKWIEQLEKDIDRLRDDNVLPRTDGPDEAFTIYLKVSLITGLVLSSWWVFYQLWLFVAAGLYPHERKYVWRYMPMSIVLFLGGVFFSFYGVIPFVLDFLFSFNTWLGLRPEMKITTWISFALMVSLMFGVSFQLPLVMLFLDRLGIVTAKVYREKRRISIFAISVISMVLTPSDPVSMLMMMVPLLILYELGIVLCRTGAPVTRSPFETKTA
jgi:sec-independent protein translocase protein TatC